MIDPGNLDEQKLPLTIRAVYNGLHFLLICPLDERLRRRIPFQAAGILVEGHPLQGEGCTPRNLAALAQAILADPRRDPIIDFLFEAIRLRRQYRQGL